MSNLIFSLNATAPIFLLMLLGILLHRLGLFDDDFAAKANKFVFQVTLPILLFSDLSSVDFSQVWDTKFIIFCFVVTLLSISIAAAFSLLWRDRSVRGEFIQASYRSSAALLGIAYITNIYGNSGMASVMIIGCVPLYNIMAVAVLSFFQPGHKTADAALMKRTVKGICTNPIILGILAGLIWSSLHLPMPSVLKKTVTSAGSISTPLGLMAMGTSFNRKKALGKLAPSVMAALIKLFILPALFLPAAVMFGFRDEALVAILVMLGSATTVSSFVMARSMGHEGILSSNVVMLTTLLSSVSLTFWLWLLRSLGCL